MEVVSPGASNGGLAASSPLPLADPSVVVQHLTEVLQVTLGALKKDLESAGSLLSKAKYSETVQRCTRFASETQVALYAQKELVGTEQSNGTDDEESCTYHQE